MIPPIHFIGIIANYFIIAQISNDSAKLVPIFLPLSLSSLPSKGCLAAFNHVIYNESYLMPPIYVINIRKIQLFRK
jgi:hypothetical protein